MAALAQLSVEVLVGAKLGIFVHGYLPPKSGVPAPGWLHTYGAFVLKVYRTEICVLFVALTRAQDSLYFVGGLPTHTGLQSVMEKYAKKDTAA